METRNTQYGYISVFVSSDEFRLHLGGFRELQHDAHSILNEVVGCQDEPLCRHESCALKGAVRMRCHDSRNAGRGRRRNGSH